MYVCTYVRTYFIHCIVTVISLIFECAYKSLLPHCMYYSHSLLEAYPGIITEDTLKVWSYVCMDV